MNIKRIATISIIVMLILFLSPHASANTDEYYSEQLEASGAADLSDYLSEETLDYMRKIGCENIEFEKILDVSLESVFELIGSFIKDGISAPIKGFLTASGAVMLVCVISGFFPDDEKSKLVLNAVCGCFIIIGIFSPSMQSIRAAASAIGACAAFEKALVPVLAAILTVGGNPVTAISFKGSAFAAAQVIEILSENFVLPLVGICAALGLTGAILPTLRLSAVSDILRKTMTTVLACASGLFIAFLGMKSILASGSDSLAVKGIKMASSTFVPVIGGALGDAYSSVIGSLSLLRSTVGIYAVIAFLMIGLPVVINLALWALAMRFTSAVSDLLDCRVCSEVLKNAGFVFSMINTLLLLCMAVFIISAGLMILLKTGA